MYKIILYTFILCLPIQIFAQKYLSGTITQNTVWNGDIFINGDLTISKGVVLTIEAGSRILFKPKTDVKKSGKDPEKAELIIQGSLIARSYSNQKLITFSSESSNPQMNDWYGIIIKNPNTKSYLRYCLIEFGYKGITCYGSNPDIIDCEIQFNHHSGISCEVRSKPVVSGNVIFGNGFAGINCELASMPIISQCTISQNNFGIVVFSKSAPDLGRYPKVENSSIGENKIFNNFEYNVYNHSTNTLYAQNNYWNVTSRADIQQALFDKNNNPAYGEVIFVPIYRQPRRQKQIPAVIVLKDDNLNKPPIVDTTVVAEVKVEDQTPEIDSSNTLAVATIPVVTEKLNTSEENLETNNQEEESPPIAENVSDLQPTETGEPVNEKPVMKEPILEVFLDSGKRQYYKRVMPQYPDIYMRTGTEGDVFIEVVVDRKGQIEDYRVLRSDGDYFTKAAIEALNEFRYKPGLYQGQPISFKTVERFRFKMQF